MVGAAQDGVLHERDQIPCMNFAIFNGRILQWQRPWGQIGTSGKAFLAECAQSTDTGALLLHFYRERERERERLDLFQRTQG
jgi:hypothetical protein